MVGASLNCNLEMILVTHDDPSLAERPEFNLGIPCLDHDWYNLEPQARNCALPPSLNLPW